MASTIYKIDMQKEFSIIALTKDDINANESEELRGACSALLNQGKNNIIIDLSNTTYMCTITIASLVIMYKRVKEKKGVLVICGAPAATSSSRPDSSSAREWRTTRKTNRIATKAAPRAVILMSDTAPSDETT